MKNPENILTIYNLKTGIGVWRSKPQWDQDFHNSFYKKLHRYLARGLNREWWIRIVDDLSSWKALRPYSKDYIRERGLNYLPSLQKEYLDILKSTGGKVPDLEMSKWEILKDLFYVATEIKDTIPLSPVFASKLCHFIFPTVYPVVDRQVIGISGSYREYWNYCQEQWLSCGAKSDLIEILSLEIGAEIFEQFPWPTKIVELCVMGNKEKSEGISR